MTLAHLDAFTRWSAVYDRAKVRCEVAAYRGTVPDWSEIDPDGVLNESERRAVETIARERVATQR